MVFHCLSVPYAPTKKDISLCAFVQQTYKFCNEMVERGHTVYHYGHKDSIVNCTEHINVINDNILINSYEIFCECLPTIQVVDRKAEKIYLPTLIF